MKKQHLFHVINIYVYQSRKVYRVYKYCMHAYIYSKKSLSIDNNVEIVPNESMDNCINYICSLRYYKN